MSKKKKLTPETYYKKYVRAIIKKMKQAIESGYKARREREKCWFAADPHIGIPVENVKQDKLYIQTLEQKIKHLEEDRDRILAEWKKEQISRDYIIERLRASNKAIWETYGPIGTKNAVNATGLQSKCRTP